MFCFNSSRPNHGWRDKTKSIFISIKLLEKHGTLRVKETMVYANEKKIYNSNRNLIMIENTKIKSIGLIAYSQH